MFFPNDSCWSGLWSHVSEAPKWLVRNTGSVWPSFSNSCWGYILYSPTHPRSSPLLGWWWRLRGPVQLSTSCSSCWPAMSVHFLLHSNSWSCFMILTHEIVCRWSVPFGTSCQSRGKKCVGSVFATPSPTATTCILTVKLWMTPPEDLGLHPAI